MRILILAQHYAPEDVSGAVLATELASDLARGGHQVTFVTCAPNYPEGEVFPGYRNRFWYEETLDGVRVVRVWSYISPKRDFTRRALNFATFSAAALYGGLFAGRHDVILSYSPPLTLGIPAWILSRTWRAPWMLRVEDLYPDAAVAAGVLSNPASIRLFSRLERFLYRKARRISLISEGFRANLLEKGVPPAKLSVEPVWADPSSVFPQSKENEFRSRHNLQGKFVVMYAGTLGLTSCLEDVIRAAAHLSNDPAVRFTIVGSGVKKDDLVRMAAEQRLENILFLPFLPRAEFSGMMAAADLHLVTLNPQSSRFSMPNKLYNIMASGRPVLAVVPAESEVARLVVAASCGMVVEPGVPESLAGQIHACAMDPDGLARMGENGRVFLEEHYSRARCVGLFESNLMDMLQG
jgi:colanic acid biosynthesis glycosyl transferase WcaI